MKAKIIFGKNTKIIKSPCSVLIPQKILHTYKLINGKGWFIHVVLKPDFNSSLFEGEIKDKKINLKNFYKVFEKQSVRPKETERPVGAGANELKNPQRYVLVKPTLFAKAGVYAALHQIYSDIPFTLNQRLHSNYEDEVYIFFSKSGRSLQVDMFSSENRKARIKSPVTIYHQKGSLHKYDYVSGEGFMFIVLKETVPGEGYRYIPLNRTLRK